MRVVLQRVKQASVHVDGQLVSSIGPGILALVGITHDDTPEQMDTLVKRILTTKLWPEGAICQGTAVAAAPEARPWRTSVTELGGEVLCGTKPDFHMAMGGEQAQPFYQAFLDKLRSAYAAEKIQDGQFGAMMDVSLVNDVGFMRSSSAIDTAEKRS
ncbi:D-tyrosyl-tRNA(Tyr) deacylase [Malassezia nana]|uniref:D-aminoacyl-tRNA deacylase n=1 Tax=Malassezia nana TaxID=180528 RepID=A0AAF0EI20_9BASI|nr:D-tyrosyl-tRNA(Tyr) deacylase [Malassezia nana]